MMYVDVCLYMHMKYKYENFNAIYIACYWTEHLLYLGSFSMVAQHSSHANPWCCWFASFFSTSLDLLQFAHWNFRISLSFIIVF